MAAGEGWIGPLALCRAAPGECKAQVQLRATLLCPAGRLGVVISLPLVPSGGWSASRARSELALMALAGAVVGLTMAVAAVLAERRPSAGAAGVSARVGRWGQVLRLACLLSL